MSDQPCATPLSDLRASALQHYDELATQAHHWMSVIPRAINAYFDAEEAKAASGRPPMRSEPRSDERKVTNASDYRVEMFEAFALFNRGDHRAGCARALKAFDGLRESLVNEIGDLEAEVERARSAAAVGERLRDAINEYDYLRRECPDEATRDAGWQAVLSVSPPREGETA